MSDKQATVEALRTLADYIENGSVNLVRSDVVRAENVKPTKFPYYAPTRLSLFVEVSC